MSKVARRGAGLSTDATLGLLGCCLAAASATFGVVMTIHGPLATFGKSGDFTVFAQLAPRAKPASIFAKDGVDTLDRTATASIPKRAALTSEHASVSSVILQAASPDAATILVDGHSQIVRVGDKIPGVGEILSIVAGERPFIRTSQGLIASTREP